MMPEAGRNQEVDRSRLLPVTGQDFSHTADPTVEAAGLQATTEYEGK
jgi:hypothetical protein